jgi:hypothetical protein
MEGLLGTGEDYANKTMSSSIREAMGKEAINKENKDLSAQGKMQAMKMISSTVGAAASIGLMVAML